MTVISFKQKRTQHAIQEFNATSVLPVYFRDDLFLIDYSDIWSFVSECKSEDQDLIFRIRDAYIIHRKNSIKEKMDEKNSLSLEKEKEYTDLKKKFKTRNKKFLSPVVHSGYRDIENPCTILVYESTRALNEQMGDFPLSRSPEINLFILEFFFENASDLIDAFEHDCLLLIDKLKEFEKSGFMDTHTDLFPESRMLTDARNHLAEFSSCMKSTRKIMESFL